MSIEREIIRRLIESRVSESFIYKGYRYWRYDDKCHKAKLDSMTDKHSEDTEDISDDEYYDAKDRRNDTMEYYKDLDDETIHDIKRMSHALSEIDNDNDLSPNDKTRYKAILKGYLSQSQEHNIPIKDYKPSDKRSGIQYSELNHILDKYTPPLAKSDYSRTQTYDIVRRKYK